MSKIQISKKRKKYFDCKGDRFDDSDSDEDNFITKHSKKNDETIDARLFVRDLKKTKSDLHAKHKLSLLPEFKAKGHFATVEEALQYLRTTVNELPLLQRNNQSSISKKSLPPVIWRHFLYALFDDLTEVDDQLRELENKNEIRILSHASTSRCSEVIVFVDDFIQFFQDDKKNLLIDLFISKVLKNIKHTKYTLDELSKVGFPLAAVTKFVTLGLLTATDISVNERQLSFPGLGKLVNALHCGRKALLGIIRKSKHSQAQQSELGKRVMPQSIAVDGFGLELHLLDVYGANLVQVNDLVGDLLLSPVKR